MVGRMDGYLDMFDYAGKLCKEIKAHYKPISTIYYFSGYLVTGSFDGIVKVSSRTSIFTRAFHFWFFLGLAR